MFLGFGSYLKWEEFCIAVQDCRRRSKWRVTSRSSLGECSLTFLASISSGRSSAHIGQVQTLPAKGRSQLLQTQVTCEISGSTCWERSMQTHVCSHQATAVTCSFQSKQAVKGCFRCPYIIFHCVIQIPLGVFFKHEFRVLFDEWEW